MLAVVTLALICIWLPAGAGTTALASSQVKVSVSVLDSVGVNFGKSALWTASRDKAGQAVTRLVNQAVGIPLADSFSLAGSSQNSQPPAEIVVTVVNL